MNYNTHRARGKSFAPFRTKVDPVHLLATTHEKSDISHGVVPESPPVHLLATIHGEPKVSNCLTPVPQLILFTDNL